MLDLVLNLVISGIPSIQYKIIWRYTIMIKVLNLVISGIPSILITKNYVKEEITGFKPCYKWNTFNTS